MNDDLLQILSTFKTFELVGSRVTCNPPPTDTDCDILCLTDDINSSITKLHDAGFELSGSDPNHYRTEDLDTEISGSIYTSVSASWPQDFWSVKKADINIIVTNDKQFYDTFLLATRVSKKLNLMLKDDRVTLFQAILYGNG